MAKIKKIYDDAARTNQVYPQTHEKAVVDNNGTTAETKFQMITDLVQQAQMEAGAVPSDLTPTKSSAHWVTSGGVQAALHGITNEEYYEINGEGAGTARDAGTQTYAFYGYSVEEPVKVLSIKNLNKQARSTSDTLIFFVLDKTTTTISQRYVINFDGSKDDDIDVSGLGITINTNETFAFASGVSSPAYASGSWNTSVRRYEKNDGYLGHVIYNARNKTVGEDMGKNSSYTFTGYPSFAINMVGKSRLDVIDEMQVQVAQNTSDIAEINSVTTIDINGTGTKADASKNTFAFYGFSVPEKMYVQTIKNLNNAANASSDKLILFIVDKNTTEIHKRYEITFDGTTKTSIDVSDLEITIDTDETFAFASGVDNPTYSSSAWNTSVTYCTASSGGYDLEVLNAASYRSKEEGETLGRNSQYIRTGYPSFEMVMVGKSRVEKVDDLEEKVAQNTADIANMGSASTSDKKIVALGDSITHLNISAPTRGWFTYFLQKVIFNSSVNYARSGATWTNTANTTYDITENVVTISDDNVIYNQVNRLINDIDGGADVPDYIIIAAGTNDGLFPNDRPDAGTDDVTTVMDYAYAYKGNVNINTCTTIAKAMRYVAEMLWDKCPKAQVIVTTPLQSSSSDLSNTRRQTIADIIVKSARRLGWDVIDQMEAGVSRTREKLGFYMTTDGVHPSVEGAKTIGNWMAAKFRAVAK